MNGADTMVGTTINKALHQFVDEWDGAVLYRYIVIGMIVILVSTKLKLNVSFLIGLVIAYQITSYLNNKAIVSNVGKDNLYKKKVNSINPKLNRTKNYETATNLIFTIQDMYLYNPVAFNDLVQRIEDFFELYEKIERDHSIAHLEIDRMITHKRGVLNHMHSLLIRLPNDPNMVYKLNRTISDMDTELTRYIDHLTYLIDNEIYKNGYTSGTKLFNTLDPSNKYRDIDLPFTYEVY